MAKHDGGPAFPVVADTEFDSGYHSTVDSPGMSLRDYFAAAALTGLLASSHQQSLLEAGCPSYEEAQADIAKECFEFADKMLAERERPREQTPDVKG